MLRLVAFALASASAVVSCAQKPPGFSTERLSADVKELSSDAYEGRSPDSPGELKTVEFLTRAFKDAGLSPGGDKFMKDGQRAWTQAVPLGRFEISGPVKLSATAGGETLDWTQGEQVAVRAAMNGATAVKVGQVPLVFVGYGVNAPERNWDDYKGIDLTGKIGLVLVNDPDFESGEGDFGGKAMTYYGRWTYKFEEAARRGAVGMLVVHETGPASYGWDTVKNSNTHTMFDIVRAKPAADHTMIEGWIQRDVTADLFRRAGLDFDALKKQAQTRDFKPVELSGVTFNAEYAVSPQVITSHNVVGRLEGAKRPDETVVYSAHWDHLGIVEPDARGDRINNGAVDNATGTAALIEMARAMAHGKRPDRSVVFLAVTAEERGLLGSEYYAANPLYPLATTVAVLNMDGFSPWGPARDFSISGSARLELLDLLIADAKTWDRTYSPDSRPEAGSFFRSDHFPFAKRGVPAISFEAGEDWVEGGTEAGKAATEAYLKDRYHQPADEWEAGWPFTGLQRDLELLYKVGTDLANSGQWPNWAPDSEFRAARDASSAERAK
ncbi:MAG TPA: M28 family metallopeptidase [Steroidobacteraceae bacterium]|nr:M28 family metallopeptidase [Steroidobacteraceae bacterium]